MISSWFVHSLSFLNCFHCCLHLFISPRLSLGRRASSGGRSSSWLGIFVTRQALSLTRFSWHRGRYSIQCANRQRINKVTSYLYLTPRVKHCKRPLIFREFPCTRLVDNWWRSIISCVRYLSCSPSTRESAVKCRVI